MKYKWEHAVQYNKRKLCDEGGWKRVVNWWIKASMSEQIVVVKTIIKQIKAQHIRRRMKRNKNYVYKMNGQRQEDKCAMYSGHCMRKCVVCVCLVVRPEANCFAWKRSKLHCIFWFMFSCWSMRTPQLNEEEIHFASFLVFIRTLMYNVSCAVHRTSYNVASEICSKPCGSTILVSMW